MAEATQKLPSKGPAMRKKVRYAAPSDASVAFRLKHGLTVSVTLTDGTIPTIPVSTGVGKISDVKDSLGKLIELIVSSNVPSETVDAVLNEVAKSAARRQPRSGSMTKSQADVLVRSGAFTADDLAAMEKRVEAGELANIERDTRLGAITRTLTAEEAGEHLGGISASRVRHRYQDNLLYAFRSGKSRRYPLWQFVDNKALPGLNVVIPHFIDGWHPASVEGFMTTPKEELSTDGETSLTPVAWLAGGGDPGKVVSILDRIART